ncbi:HlyU family transcriptional regulator [Aurantimonas endophytica]|uniref:Transcriptional activator HlyU n=1 Tax=Aurantimonas endophytica TaxID=1522175 RepID=A0A7W6HBT2_9HYPH|nr:HlyU family transcriptional regulator [Aurantimonas endophytica]MBB4002176.1 hypothetical protein [Aurantimonas endophytica]MCO6402195.1 hypothetical protein [Aurantimonas endophytica]
MSFLKKLFGGGGGSREPAAPRIAATETYEGFALAATPMPEGGQFRLAATITKTVAGEEKVHRLIRADMFASQDEAAQAGLRKARQVVDEQGEAMFG